MENERAAIHAVLFPLLGGFSLYFNQEEIQFSAHIQTKYMQLLLMLLKAGEKGVERKKLSEFLRPEETDVMKGLNNLRQQIFLLRRVLRQSGYAVSMEHRHLELG